MNENLTSTADGIEYPEANDALLRAMESPSSGDDEATSEGEPDAAQADAATTVQPETSNVSDATQKGQAPESRIQAAVRNARAETRAEVEREYAAFRGLDPDAVQTAMSVVDALQSDSKGFLMELASRLGMTVGDGGQKPEPPQVSEFKMPQADLVSADGKLRTFSEGAVANIVKDLTAHVLSQVDGRLKPISSFVKDEQTTREQTRQEEERRQGVLSAIEDVRQLPHFDEKGVLETLRAMSPQERARLGPVAALKKAYLTYTNDQVLPNLNSAAETRVREQARRKMATSMGTVRPEAGAGAGKAPNLNSVDALAAHMERLAASIGE